MTYHKFSAFGALLSLQNARMKSEPMIDFHKFSNFFEFYLNSFDLGLQKFLYLTGHFVHQVLGVKHLSCCQLPVGLYIITDTFMNHIYLAQYAVDINLVINF